MSEMKRDSEMISKAPFSNSNNFFQSIGQENQSHKSWEEGMSTGCESADLGYSLVSWETFTYEVHLLSRDVGKSTRTLVLMPLSCTVPFQLISLFK